MSGHSSMQNFCFQINASLLDGFFPIKNKWAETQKCLQSSISLIMDYEHWVKYTIQWVCVHLKWLHVNTQREYKGIQWKRISLVDRKRMLTEQQFSLLFSNIKRKGNFTLPKTMVTKTNESDTK